MQEQYSGYHYDDDEAKTYLCWYLTIFHVQ